MIISEEMTRCKEILTQHKDLVEKLANKLIEKDYLDIISIKQVLGKRPFEPEESIRKALEDVFFVLYRLKKN